MMLWEKIRNKLFRKREPEWKWRALVLIDLIKKYKCYRIAEVGVLKGITTKTILQRLHKEIHEYWAIDRWNPVNKNYLPSVIKRYHQKDWDKIYSKIIQLSIYYPKLKIIRMSSVAASKIFPDRYFDLVFIDAEHKYESVKNDILAWFPKIKPGGLMTGHDYGARKLPSVKQAVDEIFKSRVQVFSDSVWVVKI